MFPWKKPPSRLDIARHAVEAHRANLVRHLPHHTDSACLIRKLHGLEERAAGAATALKTGAAPWLHKLEDLEERAAHTAATLRSGADQLRSGADNLRSGAEHLKEGAGPVLDRLAALEAQAKDAISSGAAPALHHLQERAHLGREVLDQLPGLASQALRRRVPEPVVITKSGPSPWLFLAVGVAAGSLLGLMLAPATGRRTRALLRDKAVKARHRAAGLGRQATGRAHDLQNRAEGVVAEARGKFNSDDAGDDNTIADRVRTALGAHPATRELGHFNIDCVDGVVTLRGPMVDAATGETIAALARSVRGVQEVRSNLLVNSTAEDAVAFVG